MTAFSDAPLLGPPPPMRLSDRDDDVLVLQKHLAGIGSLPLAGDEEILFYIGLLPGNADVTDVFLMLTDREDGSLGAD